MLEVQDGGLKQISDMDRGLRHINRMQSSYPRVFPSAKNCHSPSW